jgi:hypothetical protein
MQWLRKSLHRPIRSESVVTDSNDESVIAPPEKDALSGWESEGGSLAASPRADIGTTSNLMTRAREATLELTSAIWRRTQRTRLELEVRRLESKVNSEKNAIGRLVFPLIQAGTLQVDLPEVHDHITTIKELLSEIAQRRAVANIDQNAALRASADQSSRDASANASQSPAEQGGQG